MTITGWGEGYPFAEGPFFPSNELNIWTDYESFNLKNGHVNAIGVARALEKTYWESYKNPVYAEFAVGGPTLSLFTSSWNKKYPDNELHTSVGTFGYRLENGGVDVEYELDFSDDAGLYNDDLYFGPEESLEAWMIASPAFCTDEFVWTVERCKVLGDQPTYARVMINKPWGPGAIGFRPVVCLKSDVCAIYSGGKWVLE